MKYFGKFILALSLFFLTVSPAMAVTQSTGAGNRQIIGQEIQQQTKERIQERVATIEAKLNVRKKEIIRNHFLRMTKRLEAAINRLNRLITRIESRIAKIEANNEDINTEPIKKDIQKAKDKLLLATNKLNEAKIKIDDVLQSNTPKETFAEVKNMIQEIKKDLVEVHRLLVKVIGNIKGLRVGNTSTPSAKTE
jgi:methyl-accepting chemotaxis protein